MRAPTTAFLLLPAFAAAQTVTSVYNRDTHEPFRLKGVKVESTVIGPIVRTSTWLTYGNPYTKPTEATLNFQVPDAGALSGFAYRYGDEYVPGQLMDKAKAWFIYTAITSRGRDPGIMEQWSPTEYHCQIFPIKQGYDLRVRLYTIGVVGPGGVLPKPQVPNAVSYYSTEDASVAKDDWTVRSVNSGAVRKEGDGYVVDSGGPVTAVAQRFKDGRTYVAGLVRAQETAARRVQVTRATYLPQGQSVGGLDVTPKVAALVAGGTTTVPSDNRHYGDPFPNQRKALRVEYTIDGQPFGRTIPEDGSFDLATESRSGNPVAGPTFKGLKQPRTVRLDDRTYAFCGWLPKNRTITAKVGGKAMPVHPKPIPAGADAARLWAQQMLAKGNWKGSREVLAFSMKYGVPSTATALLAVPQEEMARYREKAKEYEKAQAEQRRRELEEARRARAWSRSHPQNWRSSGGGDPEIRITIPNAVRVEAILPDRRVVELKADGDEWGGNFEIPAAAPEGTYTVRIVAHLKDGTTLERSWTYTVDRTAPKGTATLARGVLTVVSEPGLAQVEAYSTDGTRWTLAETRPGVYTVAALGARRPTVVLKDAAGNKAEAAWSSLR